MNRWLISGPLPLAAQGRNKSRSGNRDVTVPPLATQGEARKALDATRRTAFPLGHLAHPSPRCASETVKIPRRRCASPACGTPPHARGRPFPAGCAGAAPRLRRGGWALSSGDKTAPRHRNRGGCVPGAVSRGGLRRPGGHARAGQTGSGWPQNATGGAPARAASAFRPGVAGGLPPTGLRCQDTHGRHTAGVSRPRFPRLWPGPQTPTVGRSPRRHPTRPAVLRQHAAGPRGPAPR